MAFKHYNKCSFCVLIFFYQVPPGYNPGHQYRLRIEGYSRWPFLLAPIRIGKWQMQTHANLSSRNQLELWLDTNLQTRWCNDFQQRDCPWVQVLMFPVQLLSSFLFSCRKITNLPQMICWQKTTLTLNVLKFLSQKFLSITISTNKVVFTAIHTIKVDLNIWI